MKVVQAQIIDTITDSMARMEPYPLAGVPNKLYVFINGVEFDCDSRLVFIARNWQVL